MELQKQKQIRSVVIVLLCLLFFISVSNILHTAGQKSGADENRGEMTVGSEQEQKTTVSTGFLSWLSGQVGSSMMPFFSFSKEAQLPDNAASAVFLHVSKEYPFFYSISTQNENVSATESSSTYEMILALEGADEDNHTIYEEIDGWEAVEMENRIARGDSAADGTGENVSGTVESITVSETSDGQENTTQEEIAQGDEAVDAEEQSSVPVSGTDMVTLRTTPVFTYDFSQYQSLDSLVKGFYIVDPTTSVTNERLNLDSLLNTDVSIHGDSSSPQILIYHTHSQEGYLDSAQGDESTGVVGAGEYLAELLSEQYGYNVIHHTGQYDVEVRDQAYAAAAPAIEQLLEQYPTIEVVIDLHRDEVKEDVRLVTDIDGRSCAKFMFFNGLSYSNTLGDIGYLANPHIQENLAFSFQAQVLVNEYYPGLSRGIYLRAYRYNMHFVGKNMLIELGAQTNTREEVWNTVPIIAQVLDKVFRGEGGI